MLSDTDYGRMMAISQILYSQYHIWVRFEKQSYQQKKQLDNRLKMGARSSAKNTPNTPKFIWEICPIGPKVWDIVDKKGFIGGLQFVMSDIDRRWRKQPTHMHHTQDRQSDKRIFYILRQKQSRLRQPLQKFSSLYKAVTVYEGSLKVILLLQVSSHDFEQFYY